MGTETQYKEQTGPQKPIIKQDNHRYYHGQVISTATPGLESLKDTENCQDVFKETVYGPKLNGKGDQV